MRAPARTSGALWGSVAPAWLVAVDAYRALFAMGGPVDTHQVDESAEDVSRLNNISHTVCDATRAGSFGRRGWWERRC